MKHLLLVIKIFLKKPLIFLENEFYDKLFYDIFRLLHKIYHTYFLIVISNINL